MPTFDAWDIVKVPFPYTDRPVRQRRPALVVAAGNVQQHHGLLWVLMITSAENRGWPGDVEITDLGRAGLPAPSVIRTAKIATIEAKDAERIGSLESEARTRVRQILSSDVAPATS
ncbi:PemK-like protein [Magnetospirillum sp. LM-5]|uniref:type II toxin-antitoxin system PemK/MazF family toxin n=1 Tax=Magnetospirillum sp. LM-5 TaxID=2681466 RepID=UPI00138419E6|nr:type II toxin-antitoxin system PemK/MazF family toxin [Magnetospirillum sp. LM-5]CAA7625771.1 PemK-like protein [Magnetospirillum sp. LM-5]